VDTENQARGRRNKQRSKTYERSLASDLGVARLDVEAGTGARQSDIRYPSEKLEVTLDIEVKSRVRANLAQLWEDTVLKCAAGNVPVLALVLRSNTRGTPLKKYAIMEWTDFVDLIKDDKDGIAY
tara:strand:- start:57 stop:431 length:375 start_codon:yes stop_codon:yes gene_type:complete